MAGSCTGWPEMVPLPAWLSARMAAGLALLLLGLAGGVLMARWHYAPRLEAAELRTQALGDLLREQAKGVQAIKDERARRVAEAAAALERARAEARRHRSEAERILTRPQPPDLDACTAACRLIDTEVRP